MWIIKKRKKLNRIPLKVTRSEMKSSLEDLNRFEQAEKQIRKLKDRSTKIIHSVDQKDKRMKTNRQLKGNGNEIKMIYQKKLVRKTKSLNENSGTKNI